MSSYFQNSIKSVKTQHLVSHITDFDFMVTGSESEAFVLENNLIKKHIPKYNIRLRDDKTYPYVQVNWNADYPRLIYTRKPNKSEGHEVIGPFTQGSRISEILRALTKSFSLRDCSDHEFKNRERPCLLYQIKQCSAPCVGKKTREQYRNDVGEALKFLKTSGEDCIGFIEEKMMKSAEMEEYERAAMFRDLKFLFEQFQSSGQGQSVELHGKDLDLDIWGEFIGEEEVDLSLYQVRNGLLLGLKNFNLLKTDFFEEDVREEIGQLLAHYYQEAEFPPQTIVMAETIKIKSFPTDFEVELKTERSVKEGNDYQRLIFLTKEHAKQAQKVRIENQEGHYFGMRGLQTLLKLKEIPRKIECYDIAIWQGQSPTASQVVFVDGRPNKKLYRHYHMQVRPEGNNDFAMMREVFERRLKKGKFPDLFVVDGGVAQVNTAIKVLQELDIDLPLVGIAKAKVKNANLGERTEERLIIPGRSNPFILKKNKSLFRLMVQMRDEAHRFSRRLYHNSESKRTFKSWLDEIKGIGPKTKKTILESQDVRVEQLAKLTQKELEEGLKIGSKEAGLIFEYLAQREKSE